MKMVCLCPTYGRPPHLLENSIQCFLGQTYEEKYLLLWDDLGNYQQQGGQDWSLVSQKDRIPSLTRKYHLMLSWLQMNHVWWDVLVVWDDDDIYLPYYLENVATTLPRHRWAKPKMVWSTYTGKPALEDGTGRFHGSVSVTRGLFQEVGGWPTTSRADFDQQFITRLTESGGEPADPGPTYVFRWQQTQASHCQGLMSSPDNEDWYERVRPTWNHSYGLLQPKYDVHTKEVIAELSTQVDYGAKL